jgi:hypothetical protein
MLATESARPSITPREKRLPSKTVSRKSSATVDAVFAMARYTPDVGKGIFVADAVTLTCD